MISSDDGKLLLKLARDTIYLKLYSENLIVSDSVKKFNEKQGVFVTIHKNGDLRGCIGFPYPVHPLYEGIIEASKSAAFSDSRFQPLEKDEFEKISLEISILSVPELIEVKDSNEYFKKIEIGKDGLIINFNGYSGIFLPQVPIEQKWDILEYLENLSYKAGLSKDSWKNSEIYKFQAQIFSEN